MHPGGVMMKRYVTVTLTLAILLLLITVCFAAEDRYLRLDYSDDKASYYLDKSSFQAWKVNAPSEHRIADVWIKIVYTPTGVEEQIELFKRYNIPVKGLENLSHSLAHYQFKNKPKQIMTIEEIYYNKNGKVIYSMNLSPEKWSSVVPNSIGEMLYDNVIRYDNDMNNK